MYSKKSINTVIIKPTKQCNADCSHCSSPKEFESNQNKITLEKFETICKKFKDYFNEHVDFIWHGGEPLLMGSEYYFEAYKIAKRYIKQPEFSMQTNLLLYEKEKHKKLFKYIFNGNVATSYDFFSGFRTINKNTKTYDDLFFKKLQNYKNDSFETPVVISIINKNSAKNAKEIFEIADGNFHIRVNYLYTVGRAKEGRTNHNKEVDENGKVVGFEDVFDPSYDLSATEYADFLVEMTHLWLNSPSDTKVLPIFNLLQNYLKQDKGNVGLCPWTDSCNGHFLGIEPNGDIYNCADFADIETLKFGNIFNEEASDILNSMASKLMHNRRHKLPDECNSCEYKYACNGGCMRDAILYEGDLYGKFFFCEAWKRTFRLFDEYKQKHGINFLYKKFNICNFNNEEGIYNRD